MCVRSVKIIENRAKVEKSQNTPSRKHSHAPWKGAECIRMEKKIYFIWIQTQRKWILGMVLNFEKLFSWNNRSSDERMSFTVLTHESKRFLIVWFKLLKYLTSINHIWIWIKWTIQLFGIINWLQFGGLCGRGWPWCTPSMYLASSMVSKTLVTVFKCKARYTLQRERSEM